MPCDHDVVGPDRSSCRCKLGADLAGMFRSTEVEVQNCESLIQNYLSIINPLRDGV